MGHVSLITRLFQAYWRWTRTVTLGVAAIDDILGGGLTRGALHEIAAVSEAHVPTAAGFAAAVAGLAGHDGRARSSVWIAEDMALTESGALYGAGLEAFGLFPERLVTVAATQRRDLLWAMEEALRCRAVAAVIAGLTNLLDHLCGAVAGAAVEEQHPAAAHLRGLDDDLPLLLGAEQRRLSGRAHEQQRAGAMRLLVRD